MILVVSWLGYYLTIAVSIACGLLSSLQTKCLAIIYLSHISFGITTSSLSSIRLLVKQRFKFFDKYLKTVSNSVGSSSSRTPFSLRQTWPLIVSWLFFFCFWICLTSIQCNTNTTSEHLSCSLCPWTICYFGKTQMKTFNIWQILGIKSIEIHKKKKKN